jgi:hypothetical protein
VRSGDRDGARTLATAALETSESVGYRFLAGVAHRILGECLAPADPEAVAHLQRARDLLDSIGARNELAKTLVAQAVTLGPAAPAEARRLLGEARSTFEALDTIDEPERVGAVLRALPAAAGA